MFSPSPVAPVAVIPAWFQRVLAQHAVVHALDVGGITVTCRSWGERGAPGVVLVHGGAAHARWWDHIAPMLATTHRVVALDLSGHGDSDRRETYSLEAWAGEVMAVTRDSFDAPPVVIGHSMGGMVTLAAATWHGTDLAGAIIIDTPIHEATPEEAAARDKVAFGPQKVFATREEVVARFRVIPEQDTEPYIFDHIAEHSVRQVDGGWAWKFDPAIFAHEPLRPGELSRLQCRVALLRPERGLVDAAMGEMIVERLGGRARVIDIPAAEHHVMLDQPIALVTGLRVLLTRDVSAE
ncbi:alpha/beta hydrolase (plasmid) [Rhodococcus erythropolis]|nr:alpha/beta hydrolase [Rhodococcus erythropolis]